MQSSEGSASRVDYSDLTIDVVASDFRCPPQRPLPALIATNQQQPVTAAVDEPLVALSHPRVWPLNAYARRRYAGSVPEAFVRQSVVRRLGLAAESLPAGLSLAVFDAWRSPQLQRELMANALTLGAAAYVSPPSEDPTLPPPHVSGGAVDITLALDGVPLALGTPFDSFTEQAHTAAFEQHEGVVRESRRLLYWTLRDAGFVVHELEWWHFEFGTSRWGTLLGKVPLYGPASPLTGSGREGRSQKE